MDHMLFTSRSFLINEDFKQGRILYLGSPLQQAKSSRKKIRNLKIWLNVCGPMFY